MDDKKIIQELEKIILSVGKFEKTVAYSMPAFRYKTKIICCYRVWKNHLGFYPYSGSILNKFKTGLKPYKWTKGAVQFPKDKKLPGTLIKKILKARMKEILQG